MGGGRGIIYLVIWKESRFLASKWIDIGIFIRRNIGISALVVYGFV